MPSLRGTGDQTPCMSDNILLAARRSSLELAFEPSAEVGHGFVGSGLVECSGFGVMLCASDSQPCGRMAPVGGMTIQVVSYFIFSSDIQHGSAGTSLRACPAVRC